MEFTRNTSILILGLIPIPIVEDVVVTSTYSGYEFVYSKYDDYKPELGLTSSLVGSNLDYYEKLQGSGSVNLSFKIPSKSKSAKIITIAKPLLELVANNTPDGITYRMLDNDRVKATLTKLKTKISYYDAIGVATFFNYKVASCSITHDLDEDLFYVDITATKDSSSSGGLAADTGSPVQPKIEVL